MKKLFIFSICLIASIATALAVDRPKANFGEYGLEYFSNADGYQKYVGQTVVYLAKEKPSYDDQKFASEFKGKLGIPYVIQKVTGNEKKIKFEMTEKENPKVKIKLEFWNYDEYYTYGKNLYANTPEYRVPLFFVEKFNQDAANFSDKPLKAQGETYLTIKKLVMSYPKDSYPVPSYEIENPLTKTNFTVPINLVDKYSKLIGKVYSDPECNFTFTLVDYREESSYLSTDSYYTLLNSATGKTEETKVSNYRSGYSKIGDGPAEYAQYRFKVAKSGHYIATLNKVEKPSNSAIRFGKTTVIKDEKVSKFSYVDNVIEIIIFATSTEFSFELKNVSTNSIKIIWDEAVFVDANGSTSKIMHVGTKYSERNSAQPPTTVIKGAKIEDVATPTDRVYYSESLKEWTSESMMPKEPKLKDKQIQLMLPIQIKDVVNEYIFVFDLGYILNHPELLVNPEI